MQASMGQCHSSKKEKSNLTNSGDLERVVAQIKLTNDIETILQERAGQVKMYNPFKNPILNRRLREG